MFLIENFQVDKSYGNSRDVVQNLSNVKMLYIVRGNKEGMF